TYVGEDSICLWGSDKTYIDEPHKRHHPSKRGRPVVESHQQHKQGWQRQSDPDRRDKVHPQADHRSQVHTDPRRRYSDSDGCGYDKCYADYGYLHPMITARDVHSIATIWMSADR